MSGGEEIAAKALRVIAKNAELDFAIAKDVGVGRAASSIFVKKIIKNLVPVLLREIRVVKRNNQLLAHAAGILKIVSGRTVAVLVFPIGHVQRVHVGTCVFQQNGGHSRIHTAG